jgi:transketolase
MRRTFADILFEEMEINDRIVVLTADLGFIMWDNIRDTYKGRFYNVGSSEHLLISLGIGLSYQGKLPILYSITPFLLYRPFEVLRTYINHESIPVKLVGSGRGWDYTHDGFTHYAGDDREILKTLSNIQIFYPLNIQELKEMFQEFLYNKSPSYLNLGRKENYE